MRSIPSRGKTLSNRARLATKSTEAPEKGRGLTHALIRYHDPLKTLGYFLQKTETQANWFGAARIQPHLTTQYQSLINS